MDGAAADAEAGRASGEDAGGQEPSGPARTRLALKTTPRCVADAPSAWRGYGSGLRPLAVALSRLTRVPAVCGRGTVCVARVRQWVAPTGRRAFPADAGAGSVWPMHRLRGAGTAVGCAHWPSRSPA